MSRLGFYKRFAIGHTQALWGVPVALQRRPVHLSLIATCPPLLPAPQCRPSQVATRPPQLEATRPIIVSTLTIPPSYLSGVPSLFDWAHPPIWRISRHQEHTSGFSVSQIAVLNLPIGLSDVSNPGPFQDRISIEKYRSRPRLWSSRGRIHNAIENDNEFVVRTLLAIGVDIEELDPDNRTPLVHAVVKHQEAICNLLLEKGASVEALKTFTSGMTPTQKFELLHPSSVNMHDVVNKDYKEILVLLSLIESCDAEGWTPLASAAFNLNEAP